VQFAADDRHLWRITRTANVGFCRALRDAVQEENGRGVDKRRSPYVEAGGRECWSLVLQRCVAVGLKTTYQFKLNGQTFFKAPAVGTGAKTFLP
jgi:hypothetical protein